MKKYILEIIVFVCGANLMIFELVGSRLLAPYLGSGIFVWSSIIGIILGSLSVGYWLGGKISDKKASIKGLSVILIFLATSVGLVVLYKDVFLILISTIFNIKVGSIIASIVLFSPSSILFGVISPYSIALKLKKIEKRGSTVGNLYAVSTAGSIFGTFLAGFFLIPIIGSTNIIIIIAFSLFLLAMLSFFENKKYLASFVVFLLIVFYFNKLPKINISSSDINADIDTQYSRIMVYDAKASDGKIVRVLKTSPSGAQSIMWVDKPEEIITEYIDFYNIAEYFNPKFKKTLMLGGGGYSFPKYFLGNFKDATIDVVEIDSGMTEVAKKYFYLKDNSKMKIFHQDARVFLNKNINKYDVIFKDTFNSSHSIPFHLTTKEFVEREYSTLNDDGVILVNIISPIRGEDNDFLNLEYNTYKSIFPEVFLFKVNKNLSDDINQNIMLVATKRKKTPRELGEIDKFKEKIESKIEIDFNIKDQILIDDFAPVEYNTRADF